MPGVLSRSRWMQRAAEALDVALEEDVRRVGKMRQFRGEVHAEEKVGAFRKGSKPRTIGDQFFVKINERTESVLRRENAHFLRWSVTGMKRPAMETKRVV